jgi:hypothetical protein
LILKDGVLRCTARATPEKAAPEKEKREQAPALQMQLSMYLFIPKSYPEVQENFAVFQALLSQPLGCLQPIARVHGLGGQS